MCRQACRDGNRTSEPTRANGGVTLISLHFVTVDKWEQRLLGKSKSSAGPGRCVHRPGENFVLFSAKYCTELRNGVLGHLRFFPITSNMYLDGFFDRSEKYWKIKNSHGATFCSILRFGGAKPPEAGERKAPTLREKQIIVPCSELRPS